MKSVLILDPQLTVGSALAAALGAEPDLWVADVVGDGPAAAAALNAQHSDVLLVDPKMSHENGVEVIRTLRDGYTWLRIVAVTAEDDPRLAVAAVRAGVCSWVPKQLSIGHLVSVVRGVASGESWFPPMLLNQIVTALTRPEPSRDEHKIASLSPREREILQYMVAGLDRQRIADRLVVSGHTVRTHIQNLIAKLEVHSGLEAVAAGVRAGLSASPDATAGQPPAKQPLAGRQLLNRGE